MTLHPPTPRDRYRPALRQMSHANAFAPAGGRARSAHAARRAHVWTQDGPRRRHEFGPRWSLLMIASFGSREACAVHFDVTFQTACNWFDGTCRPYGDVVAHAALTLPRFADIMGDAA